MTIAIRIDSDVKAGQRGVFIKKELSHHVQESTVQDILNSARRALWKSSEADGREIGEQLYQLFNGSGGQLKSLLDRSFKDGDTLYLDFDIPFKLDALPVELLFDQHFLLLNSKTHISRQVTNRNRRSKMEPEQRPLTMLFIACSPIDLSNAVLRFEDEEEMILNNVEKLQVDMTIEDSGSVEGLQQALIEANGCDVVHITGHATVHPELGPVFCMENDIGHLEYATPERLWQALRDYPPRLLFLSGCSTGKSDKSNAAESFAHQLVDYAIATVLGQYC